MTDEFRHRKSPDHAAQDARNRALGHRGELLVLISERETLTAAGRSDLADQIAHISDIEGDSAGYDIRSFSADGSIRYIEVKTTMGAAETSFFLSANEVAFSTKNASAYVLYRLFQYDENANAASAYILEGSISEKLNLNPTQFRAELRAAQR
ncbi:MAG: DUF3883 domain-containing protein [Candidatus Sulfotelmatobacter sp.]